MWLVGGKTVVSLQGVREEKKVRHAMLWGLHTSVVCEHPWAAQRMLKQCGWVTTECCANVPRLGRHSVTTAVPCFRHWSCCCSSARPVPRHVVSLY